MKTDGYRWINGEGAVQYIVILVAAVFFALPYPMARADAVLGEDTFDDGADQDWSTRYGNTTISYEAAGGNPDGWLSVKFDETTAAGGPSWEEIVRVDAENLYSGDWGVIGDEGGWLEFDFYTPTVSPSALAVRFQSTAEGSEYVWGYDVEIPAAGGWTSDITASFSNWMDWRWDFRPGLSEDTFLADLAAIDWIGIYIRRFDQSETIYGIDMVQLWIPEPGEYLMLAVAMASGVMALRRRRFIKGVAVPV